VKGGTWYLLTSVSTLPCSDRICTATATVETLARLNRHGRDHHGDGDKLPYPDDVDVDDDLHYFYKYDVYGCKLGASFELFMYTVFY